jgi:hypothetical protein
VQPRLKRSNFNRLDGVLPTPGAGKLWIGSRESWHLAGWRRERATMFPPIPRRIGGVGNLPAETGSMGTLMTGSLIMNMPLRTISFLTTGPCATG